MTADNNFERERQLRKIQLGQDFSPFSKETGYRCGTISQLFQLFDGQEKVGDVFVRLETDPEYGGIEIPEDLAILTGDENISLQPFGRGIVVLQASITYSHSLSDEDEPYTCAVSVGGVLLYGEDEADIIEETSQFTKWRSPNSQSSQTVALNFFDEDLRGRIKCKIEK